VQDPEYFLAQEAIALLDPVDRSRPAVIDSAHCAFVNHEVFFFADSETKARFEREPWRWCGSVTDPVSLRRFHPAPGAFHWAYGGRQYYFESDASLAAFQAAPDSFALRKGM
jgi:YHS domain-containing protein